MCFLRETCKGKSLEDFEEPWSRLQEHKNYSGNGWPSMHTHSEFFEGCNGARVLS